MKKSEETSVATQLFGRKCTQIALHNQLRHLKAAMKGMKQKTEEALAFHTVASTLLDEKN